MTTANAGLKNINWSQYATWPSFVGADGHTYYIPPGGQGYAYDPFLNHLFQDGRPAKADAQKQLDDQNKATKDANSPVRQLGTIGGISGVTAGVPILANHLFPAAPTAVKVLPNGNVLMSNGTITKDGVPVAAPPPVVASNAQIAGNSATQAGAPAVSPVPSSISGSPAQVQIGENVDGSPIFGPGAAPVGGDVGPVTPAMPPVEDPGFFSTQNLTATPGTIGSVISAAAAAKGAWDTYQGTQNNGAGVRTGLTELGAGIGGFGGPIGSVIGAGMGNLAGYGLQGHGIKNYAALAANPLTWPLLATQVAGINLFHQSTRDYQKENTQGLVDQSADPQWQGYVSAMRGQNETGPSDASMPYGDSKGNKYSNFEDYKKAGLDASNLTGVLGNLSTYGPDWAKLTEAQRQAITQKNIDSGLYDSHKGEVVISDPTLAKQNFDSVVGPAPAPGVVPVANVNAAVGGARPPVGMPRGHI